MIHLDQVIVLIDGLGIGKKQLGRAVSVVRTIGARVQSEIGRHRGSHSYIAQTTLDISRRATEPSGQLSEWKQAVVEVFIGKIGNISGGQALPQSLVASKKEGSIRHNRASQGEPKLVALEGRNLIPNQGILRIAIKEIPGIQGAVAVIFKD